MLAKSVSYKLISWVFAVTISREAARALRRMSRTTAELIRGKIDEVASDPRAANNNVRALVGRPGYRLRVGDWRVIYDLDDGLRVLAVERIAPRGEVYR